MAGDTADVGEQPVTSLRGVGLLAAARRRQQPDVHRRQQHRGGGDLWIRRDIANTDGGTALNVEVLIRQEVAGDTHILIVSLGDLLQQG